MKTFKFEPKTPGFTGHVEVRMPSYAERLGIVSAMGLKVDPQSGEVDATAQDMDGLAAMIEKIPEFVKSVKLQYGETKITSYEDLETYNEGIAVCNEIMKLLTEGVSLSKNS